MARRRGERGASEAAETDELEADAAPARRRNGIVGLYPEGASTWTICRENEKTRLGAPNDDGVTVYEFPIALFSAEGIRNAWGEGGYRVHFRDAARRSKGSRPYHFAAPAAASRPAGEAAPAARAASPAVDGFDTALDRMAKVQSMVHAQAASDIERQRAHDRVIMELAMGRSADRAGAADGAVLAQLQAIASMLKDLDARTRRLEDDDGEGDDDDDDDEPETTEEEDDRKIDSAMAILESDGPAAAVKRIGTEALLRLLWKKREQLPQLLTALGQAVQPKGPATAAPAAPMPAQS